MYKRFTHAYFAGWSEGSGEDDDNRTEVDELEIVEEELRTYISFA